MRHKRADRLDSLWSALSASWGSVTSGKAWQAEKAAHGLAGWLRVVETTHGENGWHVHVHALLFIDGDTAPAAVATWKDAIFGRWNRSLTRRKLRPASVAAQDMHLVEGDSGALRDYFTKVADYGEAVALEFTRSASKNSRSATGGRTPWQILDGVIGKCDADDLDLWQEWEQASSGRRQMTWSRGLRDLLELADERTDEEIADEELGDATDDVIEISRDGWATMIASPELLPFSLEVLAEGGVDACLALLHSAGVDCYPSAPGGDSR